MNGAILPDGEAADRYEATVPVDRFEILGDDGKWTEAYNVNGNYGGPYTNMRQLQANPHYSSTWEKEYGPGWVKKLAQARRAEKKEKEARWKGEPWPPKGPGGAGEA